MDSREHLEVMQLVSDESIPSRVDSGSRVSLAAVTDLVTRGYLEAAHTSGGQDPAYLNLTVTPQGRQHLRRLRSLHPPGSVRETYERAVPLWLRVILGFLVAAGMVYLSDLLT